MISLKRVCRYLMFLSMLLSSHSVLARLEVCNHTDLVLMLAVAYDTRDQQITSEGWWRLYPGFCEAPVDVSLQQRSYYLHARSQPDSTAPANDFSWGAQTSLCVSHVADFNLPGANFCITDDGISARFNEIENNRDGTNTVDIFNPQRRYLNLFRSKVAGVQQLLTLLGHDMGDIDGVLGEQTVTVLNEIASEHNVFALDFNQIYPLLETLIMEE